MKIDIQILTKNDVTQLFQLISVFKEVFEMEDFEYPDRNYLSNLLHKDNFIALIAKEDDIVIGGLTVYVLDQYYSTKPLAYIYDLAVLTAYQRKGIGKQLIDFINHYCSNKGVETIFVQVDKEDEDAIDFYRSTKPTNEAQVVHFSYDFDSN